MAKVGPLLYMITSKLMPNGKQSRVGKQFSKIRQFEFLWSASDQWLIGDQCLLL